VAIRDPWLDNRVERYINNVYTRIDELEDDLLTRIQELDSDALDDDALDDDALSRLGVEPEPITDLGRLPSYTDTWVIRDDTITSIRPLGTLSVDGTATINEASINTLTVGTLLDRNGVDVIESLNAIIDIVQQQSERIDELEREIHRIQ